jgi:hypothetical protein
VCGDLEPEDRIESDLYQRFRAHSQAMLEQPTSGGEMNRYLDGLFKDVLRRCVADADRADGANAALTADQTGYRTMAMQSLVLARLAGFLAGQVALNEDPMRKVMEAVMHGYGEAESPPERDHHGLGGYDGPDHDHDGHHHGDHHHGH